MSYSCFHLFRWCAQAILFTLLLGCGGKVVIDSPAADSEGSDDLNTRTASSTCGESNGPSLTTCCNATCEAANLSCPELDDACACDLIADKPAICHAPFAALYACALNNPEIFVCSGVGVEFQCGPCDAEIAAVNSACAAGLSCAP